jgi:DNA-binding response OmpR family regulator
MRVLVVSDDPQVREQARFGFSNEVEVELAREARDAWSNLSGSELPDVVVVDLQTGSAGGFSLAKQMRENRRLADIPILVLLEREADGWLARKSGAEAWRVKPLGGAELVRETLALAPRSTASG